ncbi:uncharacterized protein L3040_000861 [Drepanopeziza brunnea f. sp. 'multigermtubi']|uniref:Uncharacterized protein n=1 Tax=Marssonina brunnea f. sp. multigermtubi (strain MB_m1) TaxID=1072389 RepID=K1Y7M0_MARBU|nr:uncharacterized protein MBM_00212 [Drepanopeziza brunnea f. sp. 'multigermtubi' MB_m1]EKD21099.1 hypothetical protein MBM_00212 [Drepanopeziza brunnea f. sp. 'multigermtubi' MB_m1]KAJ5054591.1 hypothetical protein L3040_000861 [Drepanopeziza brunnea f. sp. 'multigermtubi']
MSPRHYQVQNEATRSIRTASPHRPTTRTSTSSDSSSSSASSSPSYSESAIAYALNTNTSYARVEVMRCSRCAKCVETIVTSRSGRVGPDDAEASGMVRFGHNLYYCDRCARMVGYK